MSSLPVVVNPLLQGSEATFIPDVWIPVTHGRVAGTASQFQVMIFVCHQLLQMLDTLYIVSNAARDSAVSMTYLQLDLVWAACKLMLQVLEPPYNASNAAPIGENQVFAISVYPQVTLTATQFEFVWATYCQLLLVYGSFDESNAMQLGDKQVLRDLAISQIYQLLQGYDALPGGYPHVTQLGEYQVPVPADNASQIQPPASETAQPTDDQNVEVPAGGDTSGKLRYLCEHCKVTFGRHQEYKRHLIDVHTQRRRCPFCPYEWSRPGKIKTHLMNTHLDNLPPEVLNEIRAKCGQDLVAFLTQLYDTVK